ncbi:hypothetical protein IWX90DRAFT_504596, partial [Phyllosticta citrichinensis]
RLLQHQRKAKDITHSRNPSASVLLALRPATVELHPVQRRMLLIRQPATEASRQNAGRTSEAQPIRNPRIILEIQCYPDEVANTQTEQEPGIHGEHGVLGVPQVEAVAGARGALVDGRREAVGGAELDGVLQRNVFDERGQQLVLQQEADDEGVLLEDPEDLVGFGLDVVGAELALQELCFEWEFHVAGLSVAPLEKFLRQRETTGWSQGRLVSSDQGWRFSAAFNTPPTLPFPACYLGKLAS